MNTMKPAHYVTKETFMKVVVLFIYFLFPELMPNILGSESLVPTCGVLLHNQEWTQ